MLMKLTEAKGRFLQAFPAAGGPLGETQLVKGTIKAVNDISTIFLIMLPIVGIAAIIYFQIRKSIADENDQKKWHERSMIAIIAIIVGVSASAVVKVIVNSYMGGNI
ncbi:MAG: hypothetical protein FWG91_03765 [Lachnospiraceae bacterium]|nr:hypothetical protein [Lachnospiraceae bacterium]